MRQLQSLFVDEHQRVESKVPNHDFQGQKWESVGRCWEIYGVVLLKSWITSSLLYDLVGRDLQRTSPPTKQNDLFV